MPARFKSASDAQFPAAPQCLFNGHIPGASHIPAPPYAPCVPPRAPAAAASSGGGSSGRRWYVGF